MRFTCVVLAATACTQPATTGTPDAAPAHDVSTLMDPESCARCHADHHLEWQGSMHAYASVDPIFRAMNRKGQEETGGALGNFCVKCHAPMAVMTGATTDGLNLDQVPSHLQGVTCIFCHSVTAVNGEANNPLELTLDGVLRGGINSPVTTDAHGSAYSPLHDRNDQRSSTMCGSCHDVVLHGGLHLEKTFAEWKASLFSRPPAQGGLSCNACHMPGRASPASTLPDMPLRRTHGHSWPGVDVALTEFPGREAQREKVQHELDTVLLPQLCVYPSPVGTNFLVGLENIAAGHSFPSGVSHDRRVWVNLMAYAGDALVYESGNVPEDIDPAGWPDRQMWLLGHTLLDENGEPTHDFWRGVSLDDGPVLPFPTARNPTEPGYTNPHRIREILSPGSPPDRVEMRVFITPVGKEILDELVQGGFLAADIASQMPRFELAAAALTWRASDGQDCIGGGLPLPGSPLP